MGLPSSCIHKVSQKRNLVNIDSTSVRPLDVNLMAIMLVQSLIFLPQPPKPAPAEPPAPASRGRLCRRAGLTVPSYCIPGLSIPLLTHTSCYFPATAAEPVNPRTPHRMSNHCRVFPGSVSFPS